MKKKLRVKLLAIGLFVFYIFSVIINCTYIPPTRNYTKAEVEQINREERGNISQIYAIERRKYYDNLQRKIDIQQQHKQTEINKEELKQNISMNHSINTEELESQLKNIQEQNNNESSQKEDHSNMQDKQEEEADQTEYLAEEVYFYLELSETLQQIQPSFSDDQSFDATQTNVQDGSNSIQQIEIMNFNTLLQTNLWKWELLQCHKNSFERIIINPFLTNQTQWYKTYWFIKKIDLKSNIQILDFKYHLNSFTNKKKCDEIDYRNIQCEMIGQNLVDELKQTAVDPQNKDQTIQINIQQTNSNDTYVINEKIIETLIDEVNYEQTSQNQTNINSSNQFQLNEENEVLTININRNQISLDLIQAKEQTQLNEQESNQSKINEQDSNQTQINEQDLIQTQINKQESNQTLMTEQESNYTQIHEQDTDYAQINEQETNQKQMPEQESNQTQISEQQSNYTQINEQESNQLYFSEQEPNSTQMNEQESNQVQMKEKEQKQNKMNQQETQINEYDENQTNEIIQELETEQTQFQQIQIPLEQSNLSQQLIDHSSRTQVNEEIQFYENQFQNLSDQQNYTVSNIPEIQDFQDISVTSQDEEYKQSFNNNTLNNSQVDQYSKEDREQYFKYGLLDIFHVFLLFIIAIWLVKQQYWGQENEQIFSASLEELNDQFQLLLKQENQWMVSIVNSQKQLVEVFNQYNKQFN